MSGAIDLSPGEYTLLLGLLQRHLPHTTVWAYGSRVKWSARPQSDLDLVAFTARDQQTDVLDLKEALEESSLPFAVAVLVWDELPESFRKHIVPEYVVVQEGSDEQSAAASRWQQTTLDKVSVREVVEFAIGGGWGQETEFPDSVPISVIRGTDFERIRAGEYASIPRRHEKPSRVERRELRPGDIILEISGGSRTSNQSTGRSFLVSKGLLSQLGGRVIPASFCRLVRFDKTQIDPRYAYYALQEMYLSGRAELYEQQSTGISNFQFEYFLDSEIIRLPPLPEQRAIAHVLGTLDDKIELNRRMNETLEAMARALFQDWFVDFRSRPRQAGRPCEPYLPPELCGDLFPDRLVDSELGEMPAGWAVADIESLCVSITSGGTPARKNAAFWEGGTIPWYKTGELLDGPLIDSEEYITEAALANSSAKMWPVGTILFALYASPTVGRLGVLAKPGTANQAAAGLIAKPAYGVPFLRRVLIEARGALQSIAVGAAQQNINQRVLKAHRLIVPDAAVASAYSRLTAPWDDQQVAIAEESRTLAALRDTLLPRLVSGEVRVKDAGQFTG